MSIKINTEIQPADLRDTYALMDAKYIKGGFSIVDTAADIQNDPLERRTGRMYYVKDTNKFYEWNGTDHVEAPVEKPSSTDVRDALDSLQGDSRLDQSAIKNIEKVNYVESHTATTLPTDGSVLVARYDGTGKVDQYVPELSQVREGMRLFVQNHKSDGSVVALHAQTGDQIGGASTHEIDKDNFVEFIADPKDNNWMFVLSTETASPQTYTGLEVDDGASDAASLSKINVKGMKITELPSQGPMTSGEIELTSGMNIHMMAPDQQYGSALATEVVVEPPLTTYVDPNVSGAEAVRLAIEHDKFEPMHKPSFLAYLKEDEAIVGKIPVDGQGTAKSHHDGALWFDDVVWPEGAYISSDKATKTYEIQEADQLDPNVSGGTDYLIAFRAHLKGTAPSDGFARIYLYNNSIDPFEPSGYLKDKDGNPMVVQRNYKAGEELGVLDLMGIVNAKGLQGFTCHIVDNFSDDIITVTDRTEGATGLLIQAITTEAKTGEGLQQFELDTGQNIEFSSHYLGPDRMTIAYINARPENPVSYTAGTNFISSDGWRLINPRGIKVGVVDGHTHIQDDGVHIADFNYGKVFSAEETRMLRGKDVEVTATLVDKNSAYNIALMKWVGTPDKYTPEIFTTRNNEIPEWQDGWEEESKFSISEDIVQGDHTVSHTFIVPEDANNYAFIIYPVAAQTPMTLKLKEFKADVVPAFTGYVLSAPELLSEQHLQYDDEYVKIVADNLGYSEFRYTINNVPDGMPMPVGKITKGKAKVSIDNTVNQVSGSSDHRYEGAIQFDADGEATISTELLVWSDKAHSVLANTKFWWARLY